MDLRPYDPDGDRAALWELKRSFELELGAGDADKRAAYEGKLDGDYRERYLAWVERCVADDAQCVTVAAREARSEPAAAGLVGYGFVLPERLAMVWDAAVLNELYVRPDHRGTGLAGELLDAAVELARGQDLPLDRLLLDVDPANERARAFYEKRGFEPWGEVVAQDL